MNLNCIFTTGIGKAEAPEKLDVARKIFEENKNSFKITPNSGKFYSTLKEYYSNKSFTNPYVNMQDVDSIKEVIKKHALDYLTTCGYETSKTTLEVVNFWLNKMESNSSHAKHMHYGFNLSGTYYVDVPKDSGRIYFYNPENISSCGVLEVKEYTSFNSKSWNFLPEEGDIFIWPSTLQHEVPPVEFKGIRRSIAFDILITGL